MILLEYAIKVALIVTISLALMPALRKRPAALRHWVLAAALGCAALAPAVRIVAPSWHLPLAGALDAGGVVLPGIGPPGLPAGPVAGPTAAAGGSPSDPRSRAAATFIIALWIAGAACGLAVLALGLARLAVLARRARQVSQGVWFDEAHRIGRAYGLRRPVRLLQSGHPTLLVTWGLLQPKILLPAGAVRWRADRVRLVLQHELAHVRRRDWLVQLSAELLRALNWFNPIVWIACRRLRQESEQACDDAVLNHGVEGPEYAAHLVAIARELHRRRAWAPAPSIVRTTNLERRIRAMLDTNVNRRPVSRLACAVTLLALLTITLPVAGAVAQGVFASVAGSIVDPMNGALPDVTLVLTNVQTQAKNEVRSDRTGRYEFVGLPAGDYLLEARLPGFAVLRGRVTVSGQTVQRDLRLEIGSLQETIVVRERRGGPATPPAPSRAAARPAARPVPASCGSGSSGTPIGGNLRPPAKLVDVRPIYPASAIAAGAQGTVVLQARIGTHGDVEEVNVESTPHADLASAAVDAVRDWKFDATLLNCVPVAVSMRVTVNFELEESSK